MFSLAAGTGGIGTDEWHLPKEEIERLVGEPVRDARIYQLAFTHVSHATELGLPAAVDSYERLEFLGDAVIELAVSDVLFRSHPTAAEGMLTRWRAAAVKAASLAEVAADLGLERMARLGRSEEAVGGRRRRKLAADLLEALVGAVYLDLGWRPAQRWVERCLGPTLERVVSLPSANARGRLQEWLQRDGSLVIDYDVVATEGPPHRRVFTVAVRVGPKVLGRGSGRSKKEASQAAAEAALAALRADDDA